MGDALLDWFVDSGVDGGDLFGNELEHVEKATMETIGRYFNDRLKNIFAGIVEQPGVLKNKVNCPLYLLCFVVRRLGYTSIVGGESGPKARPMNADWVTDIRDQCRQASAPFFFKQWGVTNKKKAGRLLEGRTWDELPTIDEIGSLLEKSKRAFGSATNRKMHRPSA